MRSNISKFLITTLIIGTLGTGSIFADSTLLKTVSLGNTSVSKTQEKITVNITVDGISIPEDKATVIWQYDDIKSDIPKEGENYLNVLINDNGTLSYYYKEVKIKNGINNIKFNSKDNVKSKVVTDLSRKYREAFLTAYSFETYTALADFDLKGLNQISYPKDKIEISFAVYTMGEEGSFLTWCDLRFDDKKGKYEDLIIDDKIKLLPFHNVNKLNDPEAKLSNMMYGYSESGEKVSILSGYSVNIFNKEKCVLEGKTDSDKFTKKLSELPKGDYIVKADLSKIGLGKFETTYSVGDMVSNKLEFDDKFSDFVTYMYINGEAKSIYKSEKNSKLYKNLGPLLNGKNEIVIVKDNSKPPVGENIIYKGLFEIKDKENYVIKLLKNGDFTLESRVAKK